MAGGEEDGPSSKGCVEGRSSPSESVEVSFPSSATHFVCEAGRPCEACRRYDTKKGKAKGAEAKKPADGSSGSGGSSSSFECRTNSANGDSEKSSSERGTNSGNGDPEKSSSERKTNSSTSDGSQSLSIMEMDEGMETKGWGGVDHETELRCHHGMSPRRLMCWAGKNTGRRYLACPERVKDERRDFVHWIDKKWPPTFQKVAASIWEVVGKFKKQAEEAQVDLYAAMMARNEVCLEKEALLEEKDKFIREKEAIRCCKQALERELALRTRLARITSETMQNQITSDGNNKKMLYGLILALCGVLVAVLLAVVAKK